MTEWLKVRAWKVRIPQKGIVGSNPAFSAVRPARFFRRGGQCFLTAMQCGLNGPRGKGELLFD